MVNDDPRILIGNIKIDILGGSLDDVLVVDDAEDIILRQNGGPICVPVAFFNGLVSLDNKYKNKSLEELEKEKENIVDLAYSVTRRNRSSDLLDINSDLRKLFFSIPTLKDKFTGYHKYANETFADYKDLQFVFQKWIDKESFLDVYDEDVYNDIKASLSNNAGFVMGLAEKINNVSNHVICIYKFKDRKFWYKDSLPKESKPTCINEDEFIDYLKKSSFTLIVKK